MARAKWSRVKKYEVYLLTNHVSGKQYVGKTVLSARHRCIDHSYARSASHALNHAIKKYGWNSFSVQVLYQGVDNREICAVERAAITVHNTFKPNGYNLTVGGEGSEGHRLSEEHKRKLGDIWRGKKLPAEHRAKMSATRRGRKLSLEHAAAISAGKRGKPSAMKGRARPASVSAKTWVTRRERYGITGTRP